MNQGVYAIEKLIVNGCSIPADTLTIKPSTLSADKVLEFRAAWESTYRGCKGPATNQQ